MFTKIIYFLGFGVLVRMFVSSTLPGAISTFRYRRISVPQKESDIVKSVPTLHCARVCSINPTCLGYSFLLKHKICHITHTSMREVINAEFKAYKKIVKAVCGKSPDIQNAQKDTEAHFQGSVTTYTCYSSFTPCKNKTYSVCQPSGQWQEISGLCARNRWSNERPSFKYWIPCGWSEKFTVFIMATLRRYGGFSVNFKKGNDVYFHADLQLVKTGNRIVMDTFLKGHWSYVGVKIPFTMHVGREMKIVIRLNKDVYTIDIDGVFKYNFTKAPPECLAEYAVLKGSDVSTRLVEFTP